ncbi:hypothetical protein [Natronomonas amylolytica]|uniref:hypothetical protein n=1 Tax=Natronomonas amylolytica TaxID=3108498 RepID=UPI00300BCFF0
MTRRAAETGFERFTNRTLDATHEEFSVGRALDGTTLGPGGALVDRLRNNSDLLERHVVEPELDTYRERTIRQFSILLDYVESDADLTAFEEDLLAHDNYMGALKPEVSADTRDAVADATLTRLARLAEGIEPLVASPEADFWAAAEASLDRTAAMALVDDAVRFTAPIRAFEGSFVFEAGLDPNEILTSRLLPSLPTVTIEYTDEAVRSMTTAEERIVGELKAEVRNRFDAVGE